MHILYLTQISQMIIRSYLKNTTVIPTTWPLAECPAFRTPPRGTQKAEFLSGIPACHSKFYWAGRQNNGFAPKIRGNDASVIFKFN